MVAGWVEWRGEGGAEQNATNWELVAHRRGRLCYERKSNSAGLLPRCLRMRDVVTRVSVYLLNLMVTDMATEMG